MNRRIAMFLCILITWMQTGVVFAMTSANFEINWDSLNSGGEDTSQSTNFKITDTLGESVAGTSTSANYQTQAGYRVGSANESLGLVIGTQESSVKDAYGALDVSAKTVTLSAVSANYSVGNYVAVIENEGFGEYIIVGKVTDVSGAVLTVDQFSGAGSVMSAVPAGGNDYVYRMSGSSMAFGTVSSASENTSAVVASVLSTVSSGYTLSVTANQSLQNTNAHSISDPVGSITLGDEEYGASVTGTAAYLPDVDFSVGTVSRSVQVATDATGGTPNRLAMILKLAITNATPAGVYGQQVYYTLTANY